MVSAQVVATSDANNSPSQDSSHPDDLFQSRNITIVPHNMKATMLYSFWILLDLPAGSCRGSRDGAVVRALASHRCGSGLIPGLDAIILCGLSLLLVRLFSAPEVFRGVF